MEVGGKNEIHGKDLAEKNTKKQENIKFYFLLKKKHDVLFF